MSGATLIHGEALATLTTLDSETADAVITDPPYSSGGMFRGDRQVKPSTKYVNSGTKIKRPEFGGDSRDQRSYGYWSTLWLSECLRLTRPGGVCAVFTDWRQLPTTTDALQAGGWIWRGIVVWDKVNARPTIGRYANGCEFVVWGTKGARPLQGPALPGVYRVNVRQADKFHMTGKPIDLMRQLVRIAPGGGLVVDPFMGSGTTGVAALAEGRRFIGVEMSPEYFEIAKARIEGSEIAAGAA